MASSIQSIVTPFGLIMRFLNLRTLTPGSYLPLQPFTFPGWPNECLFIWVATATRVFSMAFPIAYRSFVLSICGTPALILRAVFYTTATLFTCSDRRRRVGRASTPSVAIFATRILVNQNTVIRALGGLAMSSGFCIGMRAVLFSILSRVAAQPPKPVSTYPFLIAVSKSTVNIARLAIAG